MLAEGVLWNSRRENYQFVLFKEEFAEVNAAHVRHNPAVPRVPTVRAITPEGFHLHSPTLPAEARRRATWGYPDPHMTTPEGLHLGRAAKWNPSGVQGRLRHLTPCSGRRASSRNMWLPKWNPSGVMPRTGGTRRHGALFVKIFQIVFRAYVRRQKAQPFFLECPDRMMFLLPDYILLDTSHNIL